MAVPEAGEQACVRWVLPCQRWCLADPGFRDVPEGRQHLGLGAHWATVCASVLGRL